MAPFKLYIKRQEKAYLGTSVSLQVPKPALFVELHSKVGRDKVCFLTTNLWIY
jgi:hypothetical protein